MTRHSTSGNSVAFALEDVVVDLAHVLGPGSMVAVADDDVGRLDESPPGVQVAVGMQVGLRSGRRENRSKP